jgi:flagellar hook-associated protein 3 FlgL
MVMRVTQQSLYGNVISQANATLLGLVQTNEQVASEKRINKPSDDPSARSRCSTPGPTSAG